MRKFLCLLLCLCVCCAGVPAWAEGIVTPSEPDPIAQGWAENADGMRKYGDLAELVSLLQGKGTIFVQTKDAVEIKDISAQLLSEVEFVPDPEVFSEGEFIVRMTNEDPEGCEDLSAIEDVDLSVYKETPEADVSVYVWVMQIIEAQPTPEPTPQPLPAPVPEKIEIAVQAEGHVQGEWSSVVPAFGLSGIPQGRDDLHYAAILYDRKIVELDGDTYAPQDEGVIALRFAIMDDMGDIVSASDSCTLYLDLSAPETVSAAASMQKSYAMILTASDSLSGAADFSTDGGAAWEPIEDGQPVGYVFAGETVLAPGMLCVRDNAGNVWKNDEELCFGAVEKPSYGGGYGGPVKQHSENTSGNDGETGYDQAYLKAEEEPVDKIELLGTQLSLKADGQENALFTMAFASSLDKEDILSGLHTGEMGPADDMLVLTAQPVEREDGAQAEYIWQFDGAALRTLYATGVETLVLRVGDAAALLPTAGFTAGTRYTELKIGGTGSRHFLYSASMQLCPEEETLPLDEINRTGNCHFALNADVKGEIFSLIPAQGEEMYTEGVFCIPQDMIGRPSEEWPQPEME